VSTEGEEALKVSEEENPIPSELVPVPTVDSAPQFPDAELQINEDTNETNVSPDVRKGAEVSKLIEL
jgi:hypothetical protein